MPSMFQSAPPHGGRRAETLPNLYKEIVSIRAPARGATLSSRSTTPYLYRFNPRPRTGGDLYPRSVAPSESAFQSAPPHGGRPHGATRSGWRQYVSIRAPARGATSGSCRSRRRAGVSIRAPARGATRDDALLPFAESFNPRPRTGGDLKPARHHRRVVFQSAPPHGGRRDPPVGTGKGCVFQSAPPHGGRLGRVGDARIGRGCFNPRPRTGGDPRPPRRQRSSQRFNPRPRTGGDLVGSGLPLRCVTFQSAPPHGGRRGDVRLSGAVARFNPRPRTGGDGGRGWRKHRQPVSIRAPARGATGASLFTQEDKYGFNPRPRTGGDTWTTCTSPWTQVFQSAPPHGGRPEPRGKQEWRHHVSIRAPARGATPILWRYDDYQ